MQEPFTAIFHPRPVWISANIGEEESTLRAQTGVSAFDYEPRNAVFQIVEQTTGDNEIESRERLCVPQQLNHVSRDGSDAEKSLRNPVRGALQSFSIDVIEPELSPERLEFVEEHP